MVSTIDKRFETAESEASGKQGKHFFHPEWAGYMGKAYKAATFHVTAITMRKRESRPLIFPLGVHTADDSNIDTTVRESAIFEQEELTAEERAHELLVLGLRRLEGIDRANFAAKA